jgi:hypothetical protein
MDNLNQEDELDRQLRECALYLDDDGFTARVLQRLPPSKSARRPIRAIILLGITVLASVLAYFLSGGGRFINDGVIQLTRLPMLWLLLLTFATGVLMSVIGFVAAMSKTRELSS